MHASLATNIFLYTLANIKLSTPKLYTNNNVILTLFYKYLLIYSSLDQPNYIFLLGFTNIYLYIRV